MLKKCCRITDDEWGKTIAVLFNYRVFIENFYAHAVFQVQEVQTKVALDWYRNEKR